LKVSGASVRREHARTEMRTAILDAARRLLISDGADGVSMRAIARDLGYSPAGLYEYFPSKDELTCALYFDGADGLAGRMESALNQLPAGASGVERMTAIAKSYRAHSKEQPELYRLTFGGNAIADGLEHEGDDQRAFTILVETAAAAVASGEFGPVSPIPLALTSWALVHGFVMLELTGFLNKAGNDGGPTTDDLFDASLAIITNGYLRR
jgi:AcrR family transcriptional regulator